MNSSENNIIVVGGGIGGLTSAALLASKKLPVTILEASNEWGGCAGKFTRGAYTFPVGATLGMGFQESGIHQRVLQELNIDLPISNLHTIMNVNMQNTEIQVVQNRHEHVNRLKSLFPHNDQEIEDFYNVIFAVASEVQKLMKELPILPPKTAIDWVSLITILKPSNLKLIQYFKKSIYDLLIDCGLQSNETFVHFIDGQLIDSMQTTSRDCHSILGALALDIYHQGACYVHGGLFRLAEQLKKSIISNGGFPLLRMKIVSIKRKNNKWVVEDHKGKIRTCKHLVVNLPIHQLSSLMDPTLYEKLSKKLRDKAKIPQWGTFTLYLAVDDKVIPEEFPLFQQILNSEKDMSEGNHIFVSTSKKGDELRAPVGTRTITISTHTDISLWMKNEHLEKMKKEYTERMLAALRKLAPRLDEGIIHCMTGTPHTWERFTNRPKGMVGGFPQTKEHSLFNSVSHRTPLKNLWLCGDTIFPGAGTIGVSVSGYHVFQSITKRKYKI